jgi:hypothetical protein
MEYHGAIDFVLYKNSNNTYTLYTADGTKYVYAGLRLSSISSPDSAFNKLTFSYNLSPGYITQIRDAEGRIATFSYNSNNTLASITLGSQTWRYTYEGSSLSLGLYPVSSYNREGFIGLIGEFARIFGGGEEYEE